MLPTFLAILAISPLYVSGCPDLIQHINETCQAVKDADQYLCELLKNPRPYNGDKMFPGIQEYVRRFDKLAECLNSHSNLTLQVCEDVYEEQGAHFMHVRFDRDDLINGFQWGVKEMDDYEMWRGNTLDAWLKCEKHIYKHPSSFQVF